MNYDERMACGITGTIISASGIGLSVDEVQSIISIIVTIAGFVLGVLLPTVIKIVTKIKEAKADGLITKEEKEEIKNEIKQGIEDIKEGVEDVKDQISKK